MRLSLFARLLTLSLTVAVAAVAGTAWVVTRTTSERLAGEFTRSLEADAFIYTRILEHAMTHEDWSSIQPLLDELSRRTGRRVAMTTPDGGRLGDTAQSDGPDPAPLPTVPAALIDPFSPLDGVSNRTASAAVGASRAAFVLNSYAPFELTTSEMEAERAAAAAAVEACVEEAGHEATIMETAGRQPLVRERDTLPPEVNEKCAVWNLGSRPTPTEERIHREVRAVAQRCVGDAGLDPKASTHALATIGRLKGSGDYVYSTPPAFLADQVPEPAVPSGQPTLDADTAAVDAVVADCMAAGYQAAYDPYVADPALLFIDDLGDGGILAAAGGSRMLGAIGVVLAVVTAVTVVAGRRLVRPIRDLTSAALRMGQGDRSARVKISGRDDVAQLGAAVNTMAASVNSQEQQRRAMVSDIAHELRTPLTTLRGYLEAAQDGVVALDDELVASLLDESVLVQRLVEDLQQLALADAGRLELHPEPVDAVDVAEQVHAAHQRQASGEGVELQLVHNGPVPLRADPARLRQALGNLLTNAVRYTPEGGTVRIGVERHGDRAVLTVADTGAGIAAEHLPHIFDRFYRADPSRSRDTGGSGLGLAITRTLVEAHGGEVTVTSRVGHGSTFTIQLPV